MTVEERHFWGPGEIERIHDLMNRLAQTDNEWGRLARIRSETIENRIDFLFTGAGFWDPQIGVVADSITWPFPTRCCRTRPFDHERDDD